MSEQIFISYRREGGDVTAKLICEALKNRGYTVFYDYDSLHGGYFDERVYKAIEECTDFVLVLPTNSLDRCVNENDWVRLEIKHALDCGKNIIPVMLPGFSFPQKLPNDIAAVARINGVQFVMVYFEAVISTLINRLSTSAVSSAQPMFVPEPEPKASKGLEFTLNDDGGYSVSKGSCTDSKIFIPRSFNGKQVTRITDEAFDGCESLTSITIPNSVTTIGRCAFYKCTSLTSITIPDSVTTIGGHAFLGCSSLTSITIPDNFASIGFCWFVDCSSLTSIAIPNSVTSIDKYTFSGCSALTSINIPSNVTSIEEGAFERCRSLSSIIIPNSVTSIGDLAFDGCKSLKSITIPNSVKTVGEYAFEYCKSLTSITIPDNVTTIGARAFKGCESLKSITIPNSIKTIGDCMFGGCSLTSITIPNSVTTIGEYAFSSCKFLTSITIPNSVTTIGELAFVDCYSLKSIQFNGTKAQWNRILLGKNCFPNNINIIHCADGKFYL